MWLSAFLSSSESTSRGCTTPRKLEQRKLQQMWRNIDQSVSDNAIDEWRKRLLACVQSDGGHFEQML